MLIALGIPAAWVRFNPVTAANEGGPAVRAQLEYDYKLRKWVWAHQAEHA